MSRMPNNRKNNKIDLEEEEPTYNNMESLTGLLKDVKSEGIAEKEESIGDNEYAEEEDQISDKEIKPTKKKTRHIKRKRSEEFEDDSEEYKEQAYENSEDEEDDYEDESDYQSYSKKKRSRGKISKSKGSKGKASIKKKKARKNDYIEFEAESGDDEESDGYEGEVSKAELERHRREAYSRRDQTYDQPIKKPHILQDITEEEIIKRYEGMDDPQYESGDEGDQQRRQPSISDPKLWLVKCRPGKERECVENLYHKYFSVKNDDEKIKILSVSCFDSLKGYIYVEAFKEANVREAVSGISALRENSIKIVPLTEMTQVFNFDQIQKVDLKPKQWVRIKTGFYEGDLAQVVHIEDPMNKVYIRLVPRIQEDTFAGKRESNGDYSKKKSVKPRQKLFNPQNFKDSVLKSHPILSQQCYMWNKQTFMDGFLIKSVRAKSLITEDVIPKIEELRVFDLAKMRQEGGGTNMDIENLINTIQETQISKKKKFAKGDKIKIIKGGLKGITGRIDSHYEGVVRIIADVQDFTELLELPEDLVVKEFLPGDLVKVVIGPHVGKHGLIVKVEDDTAFIFSESTNSEFKASCHDIVYSNYQMNDSEQNLYYQLGDLVKINGTNTVCYVLDVHKYSLKLIDTRSEVKKVSVSEVTKLTQSKPHGIDCKRNPITKDDTIKIVNGPYKGKKGVIRNIFKNFVFLYNQDFISTNGIFVDKSENLEIMGSELLSDNMFHGKVNIRKPPEPLRKNIGTLVKIVCGNWKGYIGILKKVTDKNALVELTSKNKTITLDINYIQTIDDEGRSNGYMDSMNTPRSNYAGINTPAYYPQSPAYGVTTSPGWNPVSTPAHMNSASPNHYGSSSYNYR